MKLNFCRKKTDKIRKKLDRTFEKHKETYN